MLKLDITGEKGTLMKTIFRLLTQLSSRRSISYLAGRLAKSKWSKRWIPHFIKVYRINVEEAEKRPEEYPHLNAFFTRRLKEGVRPIHPEPDTVVSPVDAIVTGIGEIREGTILNVKGQRYTLAEMLQDTEREKKYRNGYYLVLYLSPTDYHRIHAPISGEIIHTRSIKGKVYPVNRFGMQHMKRVLSRNRRLITYLQNEYTEVAIVKVGAMNVASIQWSERLQSKRVEKGDELAYFEFGSTVVLLIREESFQFIHGLTEGDRVKMGEPVGRMVMYKDLL
ncbi:phosphatidylserine decarboxylase [Caldalkalibacillus uzonensis]|uniref:Phosphatidylserine decarboxylase proenzyme n=1 Tax=Caldalkalibacillus uzonensis TaxID=353224 RepID=A0ABU0CNS9_9BACI|nr:phosphatidylserine decarboxylase [Caldalkalibacillus uzonensis]